MTDIINALTAMLTAVTALFKFLFDALVAKPLQFIILIVVCLIAYMVAANGGALAHLAPDTGVEQSRFQKVINAQGYIPNILEETRDKIDADRLLVRQYHNGKQGISGIPFNFVQTTYVAAKPGYALGDPEAYDSYPISTMSKTLISMYRDGDVTKPQCIVIQHRNTKDEFFRVYLERYGVETLVQCPLSDRDDQIVGYIGAGYVTYHEVTHADQDAVAAVGKKVVESLSKIKEDAHPWYAFWAKKGG